jgi:flagellar biosynthesis protein FliR
VLLGFALVLTRISSFLLILPVFGSKGIPVPIKVAVAVFLSLFFCTTMPLGVDPAAVTRMQALVLLAGEAVYGLALGLIVALLFCVVQLSGHVLEQQMGLTMAEVIDPLTDEFGGPLVSLLEMTFLLLFLSANGHHLFLLILSKSYSAFPAGTTPTLGLLVEGVLATGSTMFAACLRLAAPMLAAFLILMAALALLARLIPEMEIFFIGMPVQTALGLFLAAAFLPLVGSFVTEMADWMAKLLPL